MLSRENDQPELRGAVVQLLDQAVDVRALKFHEAFTEPVIIDADNYLSHSNIHALDNALLELAFVADARDLSADSEFTIHTEVSWVSIAQRGIRRMSRQVEAMRGLDQSRLFSPEDMEMQADIYREFCDRRRVVQGDAIRGSQRLEYASRVATGQIVLKHTSVLDEIRAKATLN
jgi:hypothetical protein